MRGPREPIFLRTVHRYLILFGVAALFLDLPAVEAAPAPNATSADVSRGQYLTGPAGQCSDCHGPALGGGPLVFLKPGLPVLYKAPRIAGLPKGWSRAQTVRFLETGMTPAGGHAKPPMPQYRFSHVDAEAIAAYLLTHKSSTR